MLEQSWLCDVNLDCLAVMGFIPLFLWQKQGDEWQKQGDEGGIYSRVLNCFYGQFL